MKAIFLDRDGVINKYPGDKLYVRNWKSFKFIPRAKSGLKLLTLAGFKVFVVSNQAGVSKKIYSQKDLDIITGNMVSLAAKSGGCITAVYYCTHLPNAGCSCRKPKTGMVRLAQRRYKFKVKGSFFVGDSLLDVKTARACGCKSVLLLSGREKIENRKNWDIQPDYIFKDLFLAAKFIINKSRKIK